MCMNYDNKIFKSFEEFAKPRAKFQSACTENEKYINQSFTWFNLNVLFCIVF